MSAAQAMTDEVITADEMSLLATELESLQVLSTDSQTNQFVEKGSPCTFRADRVTVMSPWLPSAITGS
jgi:hypothetical protein